MKNKKKFKVFIACDTNKISQAKKIIKYTKTNKLRIGYKFGLEFLNTKKGRLFVSKLRKNVGKALYFSFKNVIWCSSWYHNFQFHEVESQISSFVIFDISGKVQNAL